MEESTLHRIINENVNVQKMFLHLLNINEDNYEFKHEDQYINGLYADFTVKKENTVKAIIECKGSNIGVNDFVRGIGQVYQYQHFADSSLSVKGYHYDNAKSILCIPSTIVRNKNFNLGLFKYPEKCLIVELNEINNNLRIITEKDLQIFASAVNNDMVTISPYYIRDNRLYELYICLKYLLAQKNLGYKTVSRRVAEEKFLKKVGTVNNGNWRNAFISLSSLGLIDCNNVPNTLGVIYSNMEYEEFVYEIYKSYICEYIDLLESVLCEDNLNCELTILSSKVNSKFNGKKVLFVTDSSTRYLSSWLNIMRDDFGCISFEPRNNKRSMNYKINELNKNAIMQKVKSSSQAYEYINKYYNLLRNN